MRSEKEIKKRIEALREYYLALDRFKDVHKLDMVEGCMDGLQFALGKNTDVN